MNKHYPAFPTTHGGECNGMTLRDYFAAAALQGIIAKYGEKPPYMDEDISFSDCPGDSEASRWSYEIADAMLKAREA